MYRKLLSLLLLIFVTLPISAQNTETPLIAYFNEQLYRLDGDALIAYDACMPDEEIVGQLNQSPDSTQFLIGTFPPIVSEAFDVFGSLGGAPYSLNYWLCDTTTNSLERIIAQPNGDEAFNDELPPIDAVIGAIVWSPDGTQLAWTELSFIDESQSLVTLDLVTGETSRSMLDLPLAPFPAPPEIIAWTDDGILLWVFEFDEITFFNIETLVVVDALSGDVVAEYEILNGGESDDFYAQRLLVETVDGLAYALEFDQAGWVLVDITTGETTQTDGLIGITVLDIDSSIEMLYEIDFDYNYNWDIFDGNAIDVELIAYPPQRITLSPDGSQFAFADSVLTVVDADGIETEITNSDGFADDFAATIIWGNSDTIFVELDEHGTIVESAESSGTDVIFEVTAEAEVTVEPEATAQAEVTVEVEPRAEPEATAEVTAEAVENVAPTSCENAPAIRATVGTNAFVISPTVPNRIRSAPSTNGDILGEIAGGAEFSVIGGPACDGTYTWFEIDYNGVIGWTAEGTGDQYFIEPVSDLP
ncbi:MAG: SH3 domain-containing protein [Phototrophicaceae bacterium]